MTKRITWNEETTAALADLVNIEDVVTQNDLAGIADQFETTKRSIGAKLRKMGYNVEKASEANTSAWDAATEAALVELLEDNEGELTYGEIAGTFQSGKFTDKQVQGKILSLEMTGFIKPTPKREAVRTYTAEEEVTYVDMVNAGSSLEDIAEALGKSIPSARGKGLSLLKEGRIEAQPVQVTSAAKASKVDALANVDVANLTVAEIAEATQKSERGVKSILSRRGLDCVDYQGAAKRAKLDAAASVDVE